MNDWVPKVWGKTRCEVDSPYYSRHRLETLTGGYCSLHYHKDRDNVFEVISGKILVIGCYFTNISGQILTAGNRCVMPANVPHQFQVIEGGEMIEEYIPIGSGASDVNNADIIRFSQGGMLENNGTFEVVVCDFCTPDGIDE